MKNMTNPSNYAILILSRGTDLSNNTGSAVSGMRGERYMVKGEEIITSGRTKCILMSIVRMHEIKEEYVSIYSLESAASRRALFTYYDDFAMQLK